MHKTSKLILLALSATLVVAFGASTATASRSITSSPAGPIRVTSRSLTFAGAEGARITSEVTITGSLHGEAASKARGLIGFAARVDVANCRVAEPVSAACTVLILRLPYHIRLIGFTGTLPNITGDILQIVIAYQALFRVLFIEVACLYEGAISITTNGPRVTTATTNRNSSPLISGGGECDESAEFQGTFAVSPTQELRLS